MNGSAHKAIGAVTCVAAFATIDNHPSQQSIAHHPVFVALLGALGGTLPDKLEPASIGPHHRQFFHSLVWLGAVGYGVYKAYKWEPQSEWGKLLRVALIAIGLGYLSHLIADFTTPKGLPVI